MATISLTWPSRKPTSPASSAPSKKGVRNLFRGTSSSADPKKVSGHLFLIADATRDMPLADILPNLLPHFVGCRSVDS